MKAKSLSRGVASLAAASGMLICLATPVNAGGFEDDPVNVNEGRKLEWSVNGGVASEYVFRGVSQSDEDPAMFGGADLTYGIFYTGVWASDVDTFFTFSDAEIDWYAGVTPSVGPITFDFGVIYYGYLGQDEAASGVDDVGFWEFKAGASAEVAKLSAGVNYYFSPDTFAEGGETHAVEGTLGYSLPKVWVFDPTINGTVGWWGFDDIPGADYTWWNVGLELAVEKLAFDFRYHDTDIADGTVVGPTGNDLADERFVFTATLTLP